LPELFLLNPRRRRAATMLLPRCVWCADVPCAACAPRETFSSSETTNSQMEVLND